MSIPASPLMGLLHTVYVSSRIHLSNDSVYQYELTVRQFDVFAGWLNVDEITEEMICGYMRDCLSRGLSPATVNRAKNQTIDASALRRNRPAKRITKRAKQKAGERG